ncbi:helicase associated domain-containing protein [Cryobacterium sp. Hh38]|uniref:helicase associated domain-containing protein n=1 Tax=Cryobacterium sp. Hh38 TaxID=1259156 RepID=UPI00106C81C5|nr:helicase associated domain-containing protein [Cryobacterium sp. Hh38]TFD65494.1 hypothetical protein E3T41_01570 [Cryobacterium sp. Hh38]
MTKDTWTMQLEVLAEYVRVNNKLPTHNARIPKAERDPIAVKLGYFVTDQRKKRDSLSSEQQTSMEAIPGFVWEPLDEKWDDNVKYFKEFVEQHGRRPSASSKDKREKRVAGWASEQRALMKGVADRNPPTVERQKQLTALPGWAPTTHAQVQTHRVQEFTHFVTEVGRAPRRVEGKPAGALEPSEVSESSLHTWLTNQRKKQREGTLDVDVAQEIERLLGSAAFPTPR